MTSSSLIWIVGVDLLKGSEYKTSPLKVGHNISSSSSSSLGQLGPVASARNDLDERHISTDQRVKGDCCQGESDPATCFVSDPFLPRDAMHPRY